jgi:hypothetical protein
MLGPPAPHAPVADILHLAALAAVTAMALETGPAEAAARARAAVIDDIRTGADVSSRELLARALGLGADLSDGAIALTARARHARLHRVAAAAAPEELDAFHAGTLAPVLEHDGHLGTELVGTLATYLRSDCNMNATAAAGHLHRHTVAYRLERLHELTGLDPRRPEDRERLGLALKAHRVALAARER